MPEESSRRLWDTTEILGLNASRLEDLFGCIQQVGRATGRNNRADDLVSGLRKRLDAIESALSGITARPKVAIIEWMDPIHLAGNWVPELVELAGGRYDLVNPGQRSDECEWSRVVEYAPGVLIIAPCSYSVERTRSRLSELIGREGWEELPAVREGEVYGLDGSSYLTRWSPRLVDAAERLAAILHPEVFGEPTTDVAKLADTPSI